MWGSVRGYLAPRLSIPLPIGKSAGRTAWAWKTRAGFCSSATPTAINGVGSLEGFAQMELCFSESFGFLKKE
jgi:hypothetical protein